MFFRNRMKRKNLIEYICYLSCSKIDNLYSQITDIDIDEINTKNIFEVKGNGNIETDTIFKILKGNIELGGNSAREYQSVGKINYIQKFKKIIEYCYKTNSIVDLNKYLDKEETGEYLLYTITGEFCCGYYEMDEEVIQNEKQEADNHNEIGEKYKRVGDIAILHTRTQNGTELELACSMKYFTDMGESRKIVGKDCSDDDFFEVHPHSGNYYFFKGKIKGTFEAIIVLLGSKDGVLYGSPLALINKFSPIMI